MPTNTDEERHEDASFGNSINTVQQLEKEVEQVLSVKYDLPSRPSKENKNVKKSAQKKGQYKIKDFIFLMI